MWLAIQYKEDMGSCRAIQYDTIQWPENDIVTFFFAKNKGKEKACFYAVVEEVKHWKSLIHWTTRTFSARPLFSLCSAAASLQWSAIIWCNTQAQNVDELTRVTYTIIYHYKYEECIRIITFDSLNTRHYSWNNFCSEKWFCIDTSHTRRVICRLPIDVVWW